MAITERSRHNVHKHFEGTMGEELAATLMEMLPGVGWADVARRRDVDDLRVATTKEIEGLRDWMSVRFDSIEKRFATKEQLNRQTLLLVPIIAAIVGIVTNLGRGF